MRYRPAHIEQPCNVLLGHLTLCHDLESADLTEIGNSEGKLLACQDTGVQTRQSRRHPEIVDRSLRESIELKVKVINQPAPEQLAEGEFPVAGGGEIPILVEGDDGLGKEVYPTARSFSPSRKLHESDSGNGLKILQREPRPAGDLGVINQNGQPFASAWTIEVNHPFKPAFHLNAQIRGGGGLEFQGVSKIKTKVDRLVVEQEAVDQKGLTPRDRRTLQDLQICQFIDIKSFNRKRAQLDITKGQVISVNDTLLNQFGQTGHHIVGIRSTCNCVRKQRTEKDRQLNVAGLINHGGDNAIDRDLGHFEPVPGIRSNNSGRFKSRDRDPERMLRSIKVREPNKALRHKRLKGEDPR